MKFEILDCTLRDGSYVNNFQFSASETYNLVKSLDGSGVDMIEVGHGIGLGASRGAHTRALESDEKYMEATAKAIGKSRWGVFCIPGIASLDDLVIASDYDMDFIRIGIEPNSIDNTTIFIEKAQQLGFSICVNFMKSYTASPKEFSKYVKQVSEFNIDYVYIVDSAGCMIPEMLKKYIVEIQDLGIEQKIGFHGHNNLGMAVANSLTAINSGVDVIDVTLMGMGRSGGNACSEQMASVLSKSGKHTNIDPLILGKISEKYINKYMKDQPINLLDIASGIAGFHSSYMPLIIKASKKYHVHPADLILSVSCVDTTHITNEIVESVAKNFSNNVTLDNQYKEYHGREQD